MTEPAHPSPPFPSPSPPLPRAEEKDDSNGLWYVGAIINVVGSISINLGMNLIKLGHTKRAQLDMPEDEKPPIRKFKTWVIGIICFTVGNILNFVSFAFAAQSLLAALGSLQLVCNVFFAYFVNHEPVTWLIIISTACIIGGCVLLVIFGNQSSETYTVDQLIDFYTQPAYVVYLVMMGVFVFGFYILYLHSKKVCRKRGERGLWYGLMLVSYAIYSALLGSQSVLFGKSISVILRTTFTESNQLGNWYTWVVLPLFTFTALFYVTRMNKGLRMFPAMIIVPLLQIAWTLFSIVSGMIYFQEYKGFTTIKAIMFPVGVLIVFLGVFVLTVCGRTAPEEACGEEEELEGHDGASLRPKTSTYDNSTFNSRQDGDAASPDGAGPPSQQAKVSLTQTLRFTSTWAPPSVAVSPGSLMNRTLAPNDSLRRHHLQQQRRNTIGAPGADLNATGMTNRSVATTPTDDAHQYGDQGWKNGTLDPNNSTLNRTGMSNTSRVSETSMMSTMRKKMSSVKTRITNDLGVETAAGFKAATGFGDINTPPISVFAMPMLDFTSSKRPSRGGGSITSPAAMTPNEAAILNALPKSKFHRMDAEALATIREASGIPPSPKPVASDIGASFTSSQLPISSQDGEPSQPQTQAQTPRSGPLPRRPASGSATPGGAPQQQQQQQQPPPPPPAAGAARGGSKQRLEDGALLGMLPGPAFKTARGRGAAATPPDGPGQGADLETRGPPPADAVYGSSNGRLPSGPPEGPLPQAGSGPGRGHGGPGGAPMSPRAMSGYDSPGRRSGGAAAGGSGGGAGGGGGYQSDGGAPGGGGGPAAGPRGLRHGPRLGGGGNGLGSMLPEGVPLSTANSVVLHESRPSTPPDVMLGMSTSYNPLYQPQPLPQAQGYQHHQRQHSQQGQHHRQRSQLHQGQHQYNNSYSFQQPVQSPPRLQYSASTPRHQHYQQQPPSQLLQQQQQQNIIPLSLLQRAQAPPSTSVRLPALHLVVPGMPVNGGGGGPPQMPSYPAAAATSSMSYVPQSISYAQMLAGQIPPEMVVGARLRMSTSGGGAMSGPSTGVASLMGHSGPLGGATGLPGSGASTAVLLQQSRPKSPHGLSVSRSWAGLGGMAAPPAPAGTNWQRQSPLRGSIVTQMQRPLRPWQQY